MDIAKLQENKLLFDRIIKNPVFFRKQNLDLSLPDIVYVYNDGRDWKVIPKFFATKYPIIQDKLYEGNKLLDMTILCCPFSSFLIGYPGNYKSNGKIYGNNIILENENHNYLIPILNQTYSINNELIGTPAIKYEVKVMTLRNALSKYPDCKFIDISHLDLDVEPLVGPDYHESVDFKYDIKKYNNKYHPKSIIYIIEYMSKQQDEYKYSVITSNDINRDKPNSSDIMHNGIEKYFDDMLPKIRDKVGIIIPCYWAVWDTLGISYKLVNLKR